MSNLFNALKERIKRINQSSVVNKVAKPLRTLEMAKINFQREQSQGQPYKRVMSNPVTSAGYGAFDEVAKRGSNIYKGASTAVNRAIPSLMVKTQAKRNLDFAQRGLAQPQPNLGRAIKKLDPFQINGARDRNIALRSAGSGAESVLAGMGLRNPALALKTSLMSGGINAGITAVVNKFTGSKNNVSEAFGRGVAQGPIYSGINPITSKLTGGITSKLGIGNSLAGNAGKRIISGGTEVAEDQILTRASENRAPTGAENIVSFLVGSVLGGSSSDAINNKSSVIKNQIRDTQGRYAKQIQETVSKVKNKYKGKYLSELDLGSTGKWIQTGPRQFKIEAPQEVAGLIAGFEYEVDENGKLTDVKYNSTKGLIGVGALVTGKKLQSGSNNVLELINKSQTPEEAIQVIQKLKSMASNDPNRVQILKKALKEFKKTLVTGPGLPRDPINESLLKVVEGIEQTPIKELAQINRTKLTGKQLDTPNAKLGNQPEQIKTTVYNASANPETVTKIFQRNSQALERTAKAEYDQWQKNFFKSVNARTTTGAINDATKAIKANSRSPISNPEGMKDLSGFASNFKDVYRNFKAVYGKNFDKVKAQVLDPFDRSKGAMVDEQIQLIENLDKKIVKGLGIDKGSKLSKLTQLFGEKKLSLDELKQQAGKDFNKVIEADKFFRSEYDRLLDDVNNTMRKIYPNNPDKIIPKRDDYYRHYRDLAGLSGLKNIFDTPANISSKLAGVSDNTKPKSKWLSFAQKRLGDRTEIDAVGGYLDYIKAATYNKHIDPHTAKFRNLAQELADATEEGDYKGSVNNFIEYLNDYANDLSGKSSAFDRPLQKLFGRKAFKVLNWVNNRVKANTIVGNASSTLAQFFNIPQGVANAGLKHSVTGAGRTLASIMDENPAIKKSDFIKERYSSSIYNRFDKGIMANTRKFAEWMTGVGDEIGTKYIWNMHYSKALSENIRNPIKYADDITRKLVAGRGIGEVPLIQKAKTFQLVAPFQLEVANLWFVMKDFVDERAFGKLATLFIANHIMNKGAEAIRGNPVVFDPIQAMIDSYQAFTDEEENNTLRAAGRAGGEILSNLPGGSTVAQVYPEFGFSVGETKAPTREDLFGSADPTRFGSGLLATKGIQDPVFKLLPSYGGNQIKRTLEGLNTTRKGFSESKTGRVRFPAENNPVRNVQRAIFGQYSTPNARKYFDEEQSVLGEKQSEAFKSVKPEERDQVYNTIINKRKFANDKDSAKKALESGGDISNYNKTAVAEAIYSKVNDLPKEEKQAYLDSISSQLTPEIWDNVKEISKLKKAGLGVEEREILLIPEESRPRFVLERLNEITDKKKKQKKINELVKAGVITPAVWETMKTLNKKSD